jgi:hypothetical protein
VNEQRVEGEDAGGSGDFYAAKGGVGGVATADELVAVVGDDEDFGVRCMRVRGMGRLWWRC